MQTIQWQAVKKAQPEADILVLAVDARRHVFRLACWSGKVTQPLAGWYDPETMRAVKVTHWAALTTPGEMGEGV